MARDRGYLFSRIAGCLSGYGMSIVGAEAFGNANAMVLDTFRFADPQGAFEADPARRAFPHLLEDVMLGFPTALAPHGRAWMATHLAAFIGSLVVLAVAYAWADLDLTAGLPGPATRRQAC